MSELGIDKSKVLTAVKCLTQVTEKSQKADILVDEIEVIHLQICVKKIPSTENKIKLKMPHSVKMPNSEVCLFVKDLDRFNREYESTVHHFKDLLRKEGINTIAEVIPLKSLKTEYKTFEAKRNLSNAYDIFLADVRIVRLLPTYLGKHFYGRNKIPLQVDLEGKDLAKEIDDILNNSKCIISSKGSSSVAIVGQTKMDDTDVVDNIIEAVNQISAGVTGGHKNIKQLSIKTKSSLSIPIYMSEGGPQDITIPRKPRPAKIEAEEISTLLDAKVKVYPDGRIKVLKDGKEDKEVLKKKPNLKRQKQQQNSKKDIKPPPAKKFKKKN